jgi:hypothetical protein
VFYPPVEQLGPALCLLGKLTHYIGPVSDINLVFWHFFFFFVHFAHG